MPRSPRPATPRSPAPGTPTPGGWWSAGSATAAAPRTKLFPVWRYHAFFTDTTLSTVDADITHRRHAIVETVFCDLIDGPLAHLPSGRFPANAAWLVCAGISHNLLRAA